MSSLDSCPVEGSGRPLSLELPRMAHSLHTLGLSMLGNLRSLWVMLQMTELAGQGGADPADSRKETKSVGTDSCRPIKIAHEAIEGFSKEPHNTG